MPKQANTKTDAYYRAADRAKEERRAVHAYEVLTELIVKHGLDEREGAELHQIVTRLLHAIKNQHVIDKAYADYRKERDFPEGF